MPTYQVRVWYPGEDEQIQGETDDLDEAQELAIGAKVAEPEARVLIVHANGEAECRRVQAQFVEPDPLDLTRDGLVMTKLFISAGGYLTEREAGRL